MPDFQEGTFNPSALPVGDAAQLMDIDEAIIAGDIEEGAPINEDGTLNLIHYAAWLNDPEGDDGED